MNTEILAENNFFKTSDLALAAAISLWHPIDAIDKQNPHKAQFLFKRNEELDELIESFWRGQLKVEPQSFFNQMRTIKTRLYEKE